MDLKDPTVPGHREVPVREVGRKELPNFFDGNVHDLFAFLRWDPLEGNHPNVDDVASAEPASVAGGKGSPNVEEPILGVVGRRASRRPRRVEAVPIPEPVLQICVDLSEEMP